MFTKIPQPLEPQLVIRILVVIIVGLSFLAGYYHSALTVEQQKNQQLEARLEKPS
jgi:hypothetical protein